MDTIAASSAPTATTPPTHIRIIAPEFKTNTHGYILMRQSLPGKQHHEAGDFFVCKVDVGNGLILKGLMSPDEPNQFYVQPATREHGQDEYWTHHAINEIEVDPYFTAVVEGEGSTRQATVKEQGGWGGHRGTKTGTDSYELQTWNLPGWHDPNRHSHNSNNPKLPWIYINVRVTHPATGTSSVCTFRIQAPDAGIVDVSDSQGERDITIRNDFFGYETERGYHCREWDDFCHLMTSEAYTRKQTHTEMWAWWFNATGNDALTLANTEMAGVKSLWNRKAIKPNMARLAADEPLLFNFLLWLHDKKTQDGTSNNKLLAAFLGAQGEDYDALKGGLAKAMLEGPAKGSYRGNGYNHVVNRGICLALDGANERERLRREKKEWSFRKGAKAQAEGLGLDPVRHATILAALEANHIPMGLFHEPGNKNQLINVEWDLWERALTQDGWAEILYEIAQAASGRSTFSKRITSYISFLFKLPTYLDRHAKRPGRGKTAKWRAMPVFVNTSEQLELEEPNEDGTVKTRSALTPVADNETGVITIPYAAIQMHGFGTTYCYSDRYYVAEAGMNDPYIHKKGEMTGGMFVDDLEIKLNGRDDYGLMWYTLMGSEQNTGYPSFLVIFERLPTRTDLNLSTRVHFHRVHPNRSKNGNPTPTCRLIRECYRYMAGNVKVEEIESQQGDLIFIRRDGPGKAIEEPVAIASFESHSFVPHTGDVPVKLIASMAKSPTNRLGYLHSDVAFKVAHPEHEDIPELAAGWWEVRRCKSWEANPAAVWSYTFD
jgi:hypothetical protein